MNSSPMLQMTVQDATIAMTTWLRTQNPSWGDLQLQQSVALLVQQMYQLAAAGDWTVSFMFTHSILSIFNVLTI